MKEVLNAILGRRAVKVFEPVEICEAVREQLLDAARHAPSSFNMQPYRLYWVGSADGRRTVSQLCLGQRPAATASALVVAVADIGSLRSTADLQVEWMRATDTAPEKVRDYERTARIGRIVFAPGPFDSFGALKWLLFRLINACRTMGLPPTSRQDLFKWAVKSTALACENLMIAAEALGLNTCPMEGFDGRRLGEFLGLSPRYHEIVLVIAIGRKSVAHPAPPQWRRPLDTTVTVL
jgi:nitroreductase